MTEKKIMLNLVDRPGAFPLGTQITMAGLSANPYPFFQRMLVEEPVSWVGEIKMWLVARRADVQAILADPETFTVVSSKSVLRQILGRNMLTTDGQEQQALRRPFIHTFATKMIHQTMTTPVQARAEALVAGFSANGYADLVTEFTDPLALAVLSAATGLPIEDYPSFRRWFQDFNAALGNFTADAEVAARGLAAKAAFAGYTHFHLERLRRAPDNSLLSELAARSELNEDEIADGLRVIFFGGIETTSALLSNALWALVSHPDALDKVHYNPEHLPNAIEEAFRWESPVQTCTRHLTRPATISGVSLEAGETVQCLLGAANRDPAYFENPENFEITRPNAGDHLGFGTGRHFCLGAALARLEARVGLGLLLTHLPGLRFASDYNDTPSGHEFRSPKNLRMVWDAG